MQLLGGPEAAATLEDGAPKVDSHKLERLYTLERIEVALFAVAPEHGGPADNITHVTTIICRTKKTS